MATGSVSQWSRGSQWPRGAHDGGNAQSESFPQSVLDRHAALGAALALADGEALAVDDGADDDVAGAAAVDDGGVEAVVSGAALALDAGCEAASGTSGGGGTSGMA